MTYARGATASDMEAEARVKYTPANDNTPQDESGQSAGFGIVEGGIDIPAEYQAGLCEWMKGVPRYGESGGLVGGPSVTAPLVTSPPVGERGLYHGLTRQQTHAKFSQDVEKRRTDDTPSYRQQQGLEALAEMPEFVYLGSPYAKYKHGLEEAARVVLASAGVLMKRGIKIYCPISHGHAITQQIQLPRTWEFWKSQDQPLIDAAAAIVVLEMTGWYVNSVGLTYEIECFMKAKKPILYIQPSDLGVEELPWVA